MEPHDIGIGSCLTGIGEERLEEHREVKVRLPVAHLVRLHGIKTVEGRAISDTVTEALAFYFRDLEARAALEHTTDAKAL